MDRQDAKDAKKRVSGPELGGQRAPGAGRKNLVFIRAHPCHPWCAEEGCSGTADGSEVRLLRAFSVVSVSPW